MATINDVMTDISRRMKEINIGSDFARKLATTGELIDSIRIEPINFNDEVFGNVMLPLYGVIHTAYRVNSWKPLTLSRGQP